MMTTALDTDLFARPNIVGEARPDGSLLLRSAEPLAGHPATLLARFRDWCSLDPDYVLLRQRNQSEDWLPRDTDLSEVEEWVDAIRG